MDAEDIKYEVKKAIDLFKDQTWNEKDVQARILQLITEAGFHEKLKNYIKNVMLMRISQEKYFAGDKTIIGKAKGQEATVDKHSRELLKRLGVHNIDDFLKSLQQRQMF